ncbi:MAG: dihydrodipicolinate synthase family protein [Acidimicrobiia bacterium]
MTVWPKTMPALVTPFTAAGDLDGSAHFSNVATMVERGANGLVLAGSTGEGPLLEPGERQTLTSIARQTAPDLTIVCGVHAESTRQAIDGVSEAAEAGADAALVVTPTSVVRGRLSSVTAHYTAVADAATIPVLLYSVPSVTAWELPVGVVEGTARHPNIVGMKDSGGDPDRMPSLSSANDGDFIVYAGASRALEASARAGAWGAITASANYALTDVSLAAQGDPQAQQRLTQLTAIIEPHGIAGTKHAARAIGIEPAHSRHPIMDLEQQAIDEIDAALEAAGLRTNQ